MAALDEVQFSYIYKEKLLKKHKLQEIAHMPYLWACVERPAPPPRLREARIEFESLEQKNKALKAEDDYEELIRLRPQTNQLKNEIEAIEKEEKIKLIITHSSIKNWLRDRHRAPDTDRNEENVPSVSQNDDELEKDASVILTKI
jgi:hypothetical protein